MERGSIHRRGSTREVFATLAGSAFENVLLVRHESRGAFSTVDGVPFHTAALGLKRGQAALLGFPARDVLLATQRPSGISARNVLRGTLTEVHHVPGEVLVFVQVAASTVHLAATVTTQALDELTLRPGREVVVIVKATSIRVSV